VFRPQGLEPHIFQDILQEVFVRAFACQLQPHLGYPYLVVLVLHNTAYNAPTIYQLKRGHSSALTWSATALGGAVATVIIILATLAEFSLHPHNLQQYISPHPSVTFSPCHPSSYGRPYLLHRHCGEPAGRRRRIPRSHSRYCPVFHLRTLLFRIMPSSWVFGDRVTSKSCKWYLTSFLHGIVLFPNPRFSRSDPIQAMAGMKIRNCHENLFSDSLMLQHDVGGNINDLPPAVLLSQQQAVMPGSQMTCRTWTQSLNMATRSNKFS